MDRKPFVVSAYALVRDPAGRLLLIRRSRDSRTNAGRWDLPGGKIDAGETLDQAVVREVREETGLRVAPCGLAGATEGETPDFRVVYVVLEAALESAPDVRLSAEHDAFAWVDADGLAELDVCEQFRSVCG